MSLTNKVIKGVKWTTVSTIVLALTSILKISILARFLDKSDFGLMAIVSFVMGFMDLFNDMGLTSAILHKQAITKKEYASLYWLNLFVSVLMYAVVLLITPLVSRFYAQPQLEVLIPILGLNLIIAGIGRQFKVMEQKTLSFKLISIVDTISYAGSLFVAVILAIKGYGVYSLVYSSIVQFVLSYTVFFGRGLYKYGLLLHFKYKETKPFLRIGIYQVGGQIANYINRDLDILLVGKLFSSEILGGYSLAKQLVFRPAQIINPIVVNVASPALAKFQTNIETLKSNYLKLIKIVSAVNIPVYLFLILFAPYIISIMYGDGYNFIVIIVRILSIYMILRSLGNPIGSLVIATGRTDLEFAWNIITLLVMPICIYIGSYNGITGVAFGITIGMIVLFYPSWKLLINKMTGSSFTEYLKACFSLKYGELLKLLAQR